MVLGSNTFTMEHTPLWHSTVIKWLVAAVLVTGVLALGAYAQLAWKQSQNWMSGPMVITVTGEAEITARPDIGSFSFGVRGEGADAATAQTESATAINEILAFLEASGVAEVDIATENYALNPRYQWVERPCTAEGFCPGGERVINGYEASQTVTVKVRDLEQSGALISGVGERGATNVSSLQFTIDDPATLEAEARSAAIADAEAKAETLAKDLGVQIVKMTNFYEEQGGGRYPDPYMMARSEMAMDTAVAPEIPTGEDTLTKRVNITYEVK